MHRANVCAGAAALLAIVGGARADIIREFEVVVDSSGIAGIVAGSTFLFTGDWDSLTPDSASATPNVGQYFDAAVIDLAVGPYSAQFGGGYTLVGNSASDAFIIAPSTTITQSPSWDVTEFRVDFFGSSSVYGTDLLEDALDPAALMSFEGSQVRLTTTEGEVLGTVTAVTAVPAPGAGCLAAIGFMGAARRRRRR